MLCLSKILPKGRFTVKHELTKDIPFFNNESFFKDGEHVYIHLSTEFPDFVGVLHRHQFVEVVYIVDIVAPYLEF